MLFLETPFAWKALVFICSVFPWDRQGVLGLSSIAKACPCIIYPCLLTLRTIWGFSSSSGARASVKRGEMRAWQYYVPFTHKAATYNASGDAKWKCFWKNKFRFPFFLAEWPASGYWVLELSLESHLCIEHYGFLSETRKIRSSSLI